MPPGSRLDQHFKTLQIPPVLQKLRRPENAFLLAVLAAGALQGFVMAILGHEIPKRGDFAFRSSLAIAVSNWAMVDSSRHSLRRPFIMGFFFLLFWYVVGVWHLFQTRRWRAFTTIGIFFLLLLLSTGIPQMVLLAREGD